MHAEQDDSIPLSAFTRAMTRVFQVIGRTEGYFDANKFDLDDSESVTWGEFVSVWKGSQLKLRLSLLERAFLSVEDSSCCTFGRIMSTIVLFLILFSCCCFFLATMPSLKTAPENCSLPPCEPHEHEIFDSLEIICIALFTMEYLVRVCTAPFAHHELLDIDFVLDIVTETKRWRPPTQFQRLVTFVCTPANLVDLFSILPYYVELAISSLEDSNMTVLRIIRLTRLFRLLKLGKYLEVFQLFGRIMSKSMTALYVLCFCLLLGVCFSASLIYHTEGGSWDPERRAFVRRGFDGELEESPFTSIPGSFWWCVVTFTTVGYGDVYPTTPMGRLVGAFTMVMGILVIAMPISVISANASQVMAEWYEEKTLSEETRDHDLMMVTQALEGIDPHLRCKQILIEVFDDDGVGRKPDFLGECTLLPSLDSKVKVTSDFKLALQQNGFKATSSSAVKGTISGTVEWDPEQKASGIQGDLRLTIIRGEGLSNADWYCMGMSDPYAVLTVFPDGPDEFGVVVPVSYRTKTCENTLNPEWDECTTFHYSWPDLTPEKSPSLGKLSLSSKASKISSPNGTHKKGANVDASVMRGMAPQKLFDLEVSLNETKQMMEQMYRHLDNRMDQLETLIVSSKGKVVSHAEEEENGKVASKLRQIAGAENSSPPLYPETMPGQVSTPREQLIAELNSIRT